MKKTLKTPTNIKAKRKQGFLRKMATRSGRQVVRRRRQKGRRRICI